MNYLCLTFETIFPSVGFVYTSFGIFIMYFLVIYNGKSIKTTRKKMIVILYSIALAISIVVITNGIMRLMDVTQPLIDMLVGVVALIFLMLNGIRQQDNTIDVRYNILFLLIFIPVFVLVVLVTYCMFPDYANWLGTGCAMLHQPA